MATRVTRRMKHVDYPNRPGEPGRVRLKVPPRLLRIIGKSYLTRKLGIGLTASEYDRKAVPVIAEFHVMLAEAEARLAPQHWHRLGKGALVSGRLPVDAIAARNWNLFRAHDIREKDGVDELPPSPPTEFTTLIAGLTLLARRIRAAHRTGTEAAPVTLEEAAAIVHDAIPPAP